MAHDSKLMCPHCGKPVLTPAAQRDLGYMRKECPKRGGYMWEGARPAFENGSYQEPVIAELLNIGAIEPHSDPAKGWVVADKWK